jgi:hypothetical protein
MNKYIVALALSFLLKVSHDPMINISAKHPYSKTPRRVFGISYIIIRQ